jgi:hypothetical protein
VVEVALMKGTSRALQRQVDLTTAVCQERLLATHVRHVLALVDLVADRVPFDDALDIYVRVLRLTPEQARNVGSRALAELGRRERSGAAPARRSDPLPPEEREEEAPTTGDSQARSDALFARLRRRVRGRVEEDLRHRINLAAARTEDDLLGTHVENALLFVRGFQKELNETEAVELYLETMMLPEGTADVIYHRALREIADAVLPPLPRYPEQVSIEQAERGIELSAEEVRS